jgi:hypothetical protein
MTKKLRTLPEITANKISDDMNVNGTVRQLSFRKKSVFN